MHGSCLYGALCCCAAAAAYDVVSVQYNTSFSGFVIKPSLRRQLSPTKRFFKLSDRLLTRLSSSRAASRRHQVISRDAPLLQNLLFQVFFNSRTTSRSPTRLNFSTYHEYRPQACNLLAVSEGPQFLALRLPWLCVMPCPVIRRNAHTSK